jgi:hypothetical protein
MVPSAILAMQKVEIGRIFFFLARLGLAVCDKKVKQVLCGGGTGHKEKVKEEDVTEGFCIYAL